jgi:hypothetical protein
MINYLIDIIFGVKVFLWVFFIIGVLGLIAYINENNKDAKFVLLWVLIISLFLILLPSEKTLLEMLK